MTMLASSTRLGRNENGSSRHECGCPSLPDRDFVDLSPARRYFGQSPHGFIPIASKAGGDAPRKFAVEFAPLGWVVPIAQLFETPAQSEQVDDCCHSHALPLPRPVVLGSGAHGLDDATGRYLDQGSRGSGDGTRNFVIFDDKLVDIESVDPEFRSIFLQGGTK